MVKWSDAIINDPTTWGGQRPKMVPSTPLRGIHGLLYSTKSACAILKEKTCYTAKHNFPPFNRSDSR